MSDVQKTPGPATVKLRHLVTSEMMAVGSVPKLVFCGACNIIGVNGTPYRNNGRDEVIFWAEEAGISFAEVQIHQSTHGRGYVYEIDGKHEQAAREQALLRVYEIRPEVPGINTFMELLQDAALSRPGIIWIRENGMNFKHPIAGGKKEIRENEELKAAMPPAHYGLYLQLVSQADLQRKMVRDFLRGEMDERNRFITVESSDPQDVITVIKLQLEQLSKA